MGGLLKEGIAIKVGGNSSSSAQALMASRCWLPVQQQRRGHVVNDERRTIDERMKPMMVPLMPSVVEGVNVNVTWTSPLFKRRSRGSNITLAADTDCAETGGNSRSCNTAAAAMARIIL